MVTLLYTSLFVVGLIAVLVIFLRVKSVNTSQTAELPFPPQPSTLFSDFRVNQLISPAENPVPEETQKVDRETFEQAIQAIREYQKSPNKYTTVKLLHAAALSDNAKNYERAIELVLMSWRDGSLSDVSGKELQSLFNSEYWVLSSRTRTSGAGFVLKQTLSTATRELEPTNNPI